MKTAKSYNASTAINTDTLSEYVRKRRNATCVQYLIMMIRCVVSEMYQQDTDASTAIEIIQHESQNATREKNM